MWFTVLTCSNFLGKSLPLSCCSHCFECSPAHGCLLDYHCWFMVNLSSTDPSKSFSSRPLLSQSSPSLYLARDCPDLGVDLWEHLNAWQLLMVFWKFPLPRGPSHECQIWHILIYMDVTVNFPPLFHFLRVSPAFKAPLFNTTWLCSSFFAGTKEHPSKTQRGARGVMGWWNYLTGNILSTQVSFYLSNKIFTSKILLL